MLASFRLTVVSILLVLCGSASADIVVNATTDEDTNNSSCSLREAIIAVNTQADYHGCADPGSTWSKVTFAIPPNAGEQHLFGLSNPLPAITKPVFIDATTQSGTTCTPVPNLRVRLANVGSVGVGLKLDSGSTGSKIRGLAFTGFSSGGGAGIWINSDLASIGCVISGMDATGSVARPNSFGIYVSAKYATIGEATATAWFPNILSANSFSNVQVAFGADNALIAGNYLGVDKTGLAPLKSGFGIQIIAAGTNVGVGFSDGPPAHQRNIIGVTQNGLNTASNEIDLEGASDTVISGNYIGVGVDGHTVLPIVSGSGISISGSANTLIGCNGKGSWDDCRNVIVLPDGASTGVGVANGSSGTAIVSNFFNVAANGVTSLASSSNNVDGIDFSDDTLVARNVISTKGSNIFVLPPNDASPTAVFLNATAAGTGGAVLDSSDNCIMDTDAYRGVSIFTYGTATATPTTFENNWWGAINGPQPTGSGAYADAAVDAAPFLTAPSPYCRFDRIFTDGFEG